MRGPFGAASGGCRNGRTGLEGRRSEASVGETRLQQQLERLLVDAMRYVGAQGLACFDEDPSRDRRYRLDRVYGNRTAPQAPTEEVDSELPPAPPDEAPEA